MNTKLIFAGALALAFFAIVAGPARSTSAGRGVSTAPLPVTAPPPVASVANGSLSLSAHLASRYAANGGAANYLTVEVRGGLAPGAKERPPVNLVAVIDRSGSMSGEKLLRAKEAAQHLVSQLHDNDRLGLVHYGSDVQVFEGRVASPANKAAMSAFISAIHDGGGTNIGEGLLSAERVLGAPGAYRASRIILLSDGQPTEGVTDTDRLKQLVSDIRQKGATVSALGVGDDYSEVLMAGLAASGGGFFGDLRDTSRLAEVFGRELDQAAQLVAREVEVSFEVPEGVRVEELLGHRVEQQGTTVRARLYDFSAGLVGRVVARVSVSCPERDAAVELGRVRLSYRDLVADRQVTSEVIFGAQVTSDPKLALLHADPELLAHAARAEGAKQELIAAAHFREGRQEEGITALNSAARSLRAVFGEPAEAISREMEQDAVVARTRRTTLSAKRLESKRLADFGGNNGY